MRKLSHLVGKEWQPHSHAPVFAFASTNAGMPRLITVAPDGESTTFELLTMATEPPYKLLYVLHTPRGEGAPGRYMSPELNKEEFSRFVARFRLFFQADARFDLWSHSVADESTVAWDRHNRVFAYGNLAMFAARLRELGFAEGDVKVPSPHQHHDREEFDIGAAAVLKTFSWQYTPLKPEDEQ